MRWFSRWYGASPLHLLTLLGCLALAGYAAERLLPHNAVGVLGWLAGAVIGHDLLLMPLYTLADRSVMAVFARRRPPHLPAVPWINYLRVPAALSGMLLLIWFPLIFRLPGRFTVLTTLSPDPYLWHWVAVTGTLFLLSAAALALRLRRGRRGTRARSRGGTPDVRPGCDDRAIRRDDERHEGSRAAQRDGYRGPGTGGAGGQRGAGRHRAGRDRPA